MPACGKQKQKQQKVRYQRKNTGVENSSLALHREPVTRKTWTHALQRREGIQISLRYVFHSADIDRY